MANKTKFLVIVGILIGLGSKKLGKPITHNNINKCKKKEQ